MQANWMETNNMKMVSFLNVLKELRITLKIKKKKEPEKMKKMKNIEKEPWKV